MALDRPPADVELLLDGFVALSLEDADGDLPLARREEAFLEPAIQLIPGGGQTRQQRVLVVFKPAAKPDKRGEEGSESGEAPDENVPAGV